MRDIYYGDDFISKVSLSGEIIELKWIRDITEPAGICISDDKLYIVERFGVVVYDLKSEKIQSRIRINSTHFLNDITISNNGTIYVSESDTDNIYSIKGKEVSIFYPPAEHQKNAGRISRPNGLLFDNGSLLVASNADSALKTIDIQSKQISVIAQMKKGIIDGIKPIGDDYLVSFFEGNLFLVTKKGEVTEILNTITNKTNMADFEYIESKGLLIVPALWQHKLVAYRMSH